MRIEPANVNQLRQGNDGRMVEISADAGGVADELKRIDPSLKVRFAETANPPFWAVYHESDDRRTTYLVLTAKAFQNRSGVWEGLDQRVVKRVMEIGSSTYDYAREVEAINLKAERAKREKVRKRVEDHGEEAAHAVRKEMGWRYRGRAFVPKDTPS